MSEHYAAERLALSLSPTGANATRSIRISPELIAFYEAHARRLRSDVFACWARYAWRVLIRRAAGGKLNCADMQWLTPASAAR